LFVIQATPRAPHTLEELEAAVEAEIATLQRDFATPRELLKVRNQTEVDTVGHLASNSGLASRLGNAWALTGDWRTLFSDQARLQAVTADEVRAAARRYLVSQRRTVASLVRGTGPSAPATTPRRPLATHQPWDPS
jgi:predicted Zn-dependent peptidase